jgi:hypothetical protein
MVIPLRIEFFLSAAYSLNHCPKSSAKYNWIGNRNAFTASYLKLIAVSIKTIPSAELEIKKKEGNRLFSSARS